MSFEVLLEMSMKIKIFRDVIKIVLIYVNVSEKPAASILRVEEYSVLAKCRA
jgi:hypothetical protein